MSQNPCEYCEHPDKYGLLFVRIMKSRQWRQDGPPMKDQYDQVILVGGKETSTWIMHEDIEKLIHPEKVPVTAYNGLLCKRNPAD